MSEPFVFNNGRVANNAEDLIALCREFPGESIGYLIEEDFEKWLSHIGANEMAQYAIEARQAEVGDAQKLDILLKKYQSQSEVKVAPQTEPQSEAVKTKIKPTFFTAVATFFLVLFDRKSKKDDKPINS